MSQTHLEAEIAKAKKQAAERIAKLKRAAAAEQRKVDARVIALLQEQQPDLHTRLDAEAREALAAEREARSHRARASQAPDPAPVPTSPQSAPPAPWGGDSYTADTSRWSG